MMNVTRCRMMRCRNPGLPGAIILIQFIVWVTIIIPSPITAKHTLTTSCVKQQKEKRKNKAKMKLN